MSRFAWEGVRTLVTGGRGFLGKHVMEALRLRGADPVAVGSAEADLRDGAAANALFGSIAPKVVIHCAVQGGGIGWMRHHPVESGRDNALINIHALEAAHRAGAELFIGASSACCYPRSPPIPFVEADLWSGYPEPLNGPYALSKRLMMDLGRAYSTQHGMRSAFAVLANLYGPGDDTDSERAHVVAGLIMRTLGAPEELVVWGTGRATREHLFVADAADGLLALADLEGGGPLNIGTGLEVTVADLASSIAAACGYDGAVRFDITKPDGQPRKVLDVSAAQDRLGWTAPTSLVDGLAQTVAWYRSELQCG
jgi:GDP-L-fucose synthase